MLTAKKSYKKITLSNRRGTTASTSFKREQDIDKPHPAKVLSKKTEIILNKFKRRIDSINAADGDGASSENVHLSLNSPE